MTANPRSQNPHPVDTQLVRAEQVYPKAKYLSLKTNNLQLNPLTIRCPHPVLIEILRKHPLWPLFNETASVPEVYLQQFWGTLEVNTDVSPYCIQAQIANTRVSFSCNRLRKILQLPEADAVQGQTTYTSRPSESKVCQDLKGLGYRGELDTIPEFHRNNLAQPWSTLFGIVNRCLSGKHSAHEKCSTNFMDVYHGIVFNHHYNYAAIFWKELSELIQHKTDKKRTFLPYWRFLSILVKFFLDKHTVIPERPNSELVTPKAVESVKKEEPLPDIQAMIIPEYLLSLADQNAPAVIEYRKTHHLPMGQPEPPIPTQGSSPVRSEGPVSKGDHGESGERESEGVIAETAGGVDPYDVPPQSISAADESINIVRKERRSKALCDPKNPAILAYNAKKVVEQAQALAAQKQKEQVKEKAAEKQKKKKKKSKSKVSNALVVYEHDEGVPQPLNTSRANPIGSGTDEFSTGLAVTVSPAVPLSPPPSHSAISQQIVVSSLHGEQPHILSSPHLEDTDIEESGPPLPSTVFPLITSSLESLEPILPSPRTLDTSHAHLCDAAGTFVETSPIDASQGSDGNPTRVNPMPALNVGHQAKALMQTGNLSGPELHNRILYPGNTMRVP